MKRIKADADRLYVALRSASGGAIEAPATRRDFAALNRAWQDSQAFKAKRPVTQKGYAYHAGLVQDWAEASGNKPVAGLTRDAIERFLTIYDDRPTTRRHVKIVLKMLLDHAVATGWRNDNPAAAIKILAPESRLRLREFADVMAGAWACIMAGQSPVAAMILTEWAH